MIDDGSDDRTPEILPRSTHPDLHVIRREPPNARKGKAAALNHAYRALDELLDDADRDRVIVVIVDADGRLDPMRPRYVAAHFADPEVGGVQSLVRIYNRQRLPDLDAGRRVLRLRPPLPGRAQRLGHRRHGRQRPVQPAAARSTTSPTSEGPWRDRLTEDQDLGLRLIADGWEGRQDLRATVDQQGLPGCGRCSGSAPAGRRATSRRWA